MQRINTFNTWAAVTPSDTVKQSPEIRALYVGATGDLAVADGAGNSVVLKSVPAGTVLYITPVYVLVSGTSNGLLTALTALFSV